MPKKPFEDLTGKRFGRLSVIGLADGCYKTDIRKNLKWECICDCGNTCVVSNKSLVDYNTKSCGCLRKEATKALKAVRPGVNDLATTHPDLIKYLYNKNDGYKFSAGSNKKIKFVCPICGTIKTKQIYNFVREGISCPKCSDSFSFPEKFMYSLLELSNIDFIYQKTFDWATDNGKLRYDFYFIKDGKEYIIETDGNQHFSKGFASLEKVQERDKYKNKIAKEHGIEVIRIDCRKSIAQYIVSKIKETKLAEFLSLTDENIKQSEYFAMNQSMVEYIAEIWDRTKDVSEVIKQSRLCRITVNKYLNLANDIGLIDFNQKLEHYNFMIKKVMARCRPVYCEELDMVFESSVECEKYFLDTFNIKMDKSNIHKICKGKGHSSKGYNFIYFEKE